MAQKQIDMARKYKKNSHAIAAGCSDILILITDWLSLLRKSF